MKWTYADKSTNSPAGITKAVVQDSHGAIKVAFSGKKATYPTPSPEGVGVEIGLPGFEV